MIELLVAAQLAVASLSQPLPAPAEWLLKTVEQRLGVQNFRPRGAADVCTGATNYRDQALHVYFSQDGSWATGGDPEDECDQLGASCTTQDLEASVSVTEAGNLSSADLPAGTTLSGANAIALTEASSDQAITATTFLMPRDNADWTWVCWLRVTSTTGAMDVYHSIDSFVTDRRFIYVDMDSNEVCLVRTSVFGNNTSNLCTTTDGMPDNVWRFVGITSDNDGAEDGTDTGRICFSDGTGELDCSATDVGPDNSGGSGFTLTTEGWRESGDADFKAYECAIFPTPLSQSALCEIMTCGLDGTGTTSATRQSTYGACTLP